MPYVALVLLAFGLALATAGAAPAADWTVKAIQRTDGPGVRCVVESAGQPVWDGYQKTTAFISVAPKSVAITAASVLDGSFSDIDIAVDQEDVIRMDRLGGDKTAVFDSKYERVVDLFKAGTRVRVQLRFWPTWPATGIHSTEFSLIGFTKAFNELSGCR
jgi:hypothetical protein